MKDFAWDTLDDPEFLEDSVREEIIVPILKGMGYGLERPYRIIRSKKLLHPFVSIGSATKKIYLVPDYLLEVHDKNAWVLEAKAPTEDILNTKHVEQAYSYAMNSEVRAPYFALCNGKRFVLYHVSKPAPVLEFDTRLIASYWDNLVKLLGPKTVLSCDFSLKKDLGLHLKRLGFDEFSSLIFPAVPIPFIAHLAKDQYNFSLGMKPDEGETYVASFDFGSKVLRQLQGKIPEEGFNILTRPFANEIRQVMFAETFYRVNVDCRVGGDLVENEDEIFLPMVVNRFF